MNNFLGLNDIPLDKADVVILPIPYEATSSFRAGSFGAPGAIIEVSEYVELYDEEIDKTISDEINIHTLPPCLTAGVERDAVAVEKIRQCVKSLLDENKFVVSLGGEHTVTIGIVQAYAEKFDNLSVLQFDAHSDLRTEYEGNSYSHACAMYPIHQMGIALHQIGIRAQSQIESKLIKSASNIHTVYAHEVRANPDNLFRSLDLLTDNVYITFDADGFDPSVFPSVGTPEPGGLLWHEVLSVVDFVAQHRNVVGFDVVETIPTPSTLVPTTEYAAAKLISKVLGKIFSHR